MTVEEAYQAIADCVLVEFQDEQWDMLVSDFVLKDKYAKSSRKRVFSGKDAYARRLAPLSLQDDAIKAAQFLRENLKSTTGDVISGLEMTITKDGKFNIEYRYED